MKFVFATQKSSKMLENVSKDETDEISEDLGCTPPKIREAAKAASFDLLPVKSRKLYSAAYEKFTSWKKTNSITSENCLIVYFNDVVFYVGFSIFHQSKIKFEIIVTVLVTSRDYIFYFSPMVHAAVLLIVAPNF